ncbi:MAG: recombinase family protein [Oscillospiraceae bacterium]|nr:recombinase family protein [Oscillospiraceae bacterium]
MIEKCAIYCRISREEEGADVSASIENQKSLLLELADKNRWQVFDVYTDENFSGADGRRPEFNRMLADAKAGRFTILLCKSQSRFSRDMALAELYLHEKFPAWGVRFIAPADGADTAQRGNKKSRQINALVNQWYLEDLSENIRMVLDMKRREGSYIAAFALYGYEKGAERGTVVVDESAAAVVRLIFRLVSGGVSTRAAAAFLNSASIPAPSRHKALKGEKYINGGGNGSAWNAATVWRIVTNEMYTGVMVQGRKTKLSYKSPKIVSVPKERWFRVENNHSAIVSPETFAAAAAALRRRCPGTRG